MVKTHRVIWVCDILADDEIDAAVVARQTIANAPAAYFEVYPEGSDTPLTVEVPNDGLYLDKSSSHPFYPLVPLTNKH